MPAIAPTSLLPSLLDPVAAKAGAEGGHSFAPVLASLLAPADGAPDALVTPARANLPVPVISGTARPVTLAPGEPPPLPSGTPLPVPGTSMPAVVAPGVEEAMVAPPLAEVPADRGAGQATEKPPVMRTPASARAGEARPIEPRQARHIPDAPTTRQLRNAAPTRSTPAPEAEAKAPDQPDRSQVDPAIPPTVSPPAPPMALPIAAEETIAQPSPDTMASPAPVNAPAGRAVPVPTSRIAETALAQPSSELVTAAPSKAVRAEYGQVADTQTKAPGAPIPMPRDPGTLEARRLQPPFQPTVAPVPTLPQSVAEAAPPLLARSDDTAVQGSPDRPRFDVSLPPARPVSLRGLSTPDPTGEPVEALPTPRSAPPLPFIASGSDASALRHAIVSPAARPTTEPLPATPPLAGRSAPAVDAFLPTTQAKREAVSPVAPSLRAASFAAPATAITAPPLPDTPAAPRKPVPSTSADAPDRVSVGHVAPTLAQSARTAAPIVLPALQAFGAALHRAATAESHPALLRDDQRSSIALAPAPLPIQTAAPAPTAAPVDTTVAHWPEAMVARIEHLRDVANETSTRIRLHPDALGAVDVAVRREGEGVHVHFTAAEPATTRLLADAQPRLTELAEARGLKLSTAGETGANMAGQGGNDRRQPAPELPRTPRPATPATISTDPDADERVA